MQPGMSGLWHTSSGLSSRARLSFSAGGDNQLADDDQAYELMTRHPERWARSFAELEAACDKLSDAEAFIAEHIDATEPPIPREF